LEAWVEGYRVAWEQKDADAAAALFTEDATYRANIFEEPARGRDGVRDYWETVTASQTDAEVRMGRPFADGQRVTVEFWTNMKDDGNDVTLPGCLLLEFDEEWLCRSLREYWFFEPGRMDPPPEWGS
jgi:hypothetical protein